jgi:hypothetical protein
LLSDTSYLDDGVHSLFFSFDGDAGTAVFMIDGVNADDTGNSERIAPTIGTMAIGGAEVFTVGASGTGTTFLAGEVGFVGCRNAYLTDYSTFFDADNNPIELDEASWTEWGAQPLLWNEHGEMVNNLGSTGNAAKNGTIVVGRGGN